MEPTPEFLRPRLRLFLSVDLVGSTKLKQGGHLPIEAPRDDSDFYTLRPQWWRSIVHFYTEFQSTFEKKWRALEEDIHACNWTPGPSPELWKTNGDELLYTKVLTEPNEAFSCITCWIDTINEYRSTLREQKRGLDVKGSAWVAGFPIHNTDVIVRQKLGSTRFDTGESRATQFFELEKWYNGAQDRTAYAIDFIGPSIDIGFRLTKIATPRKFPVSLELAYLLSSIAEPSSFRYRLLMRREVSTELKGVLGGQPYPIFWLDTLKDDELTKAEDALTAPPIEQNLLHVRRFCELFIESNSSFFFRPFIENCTDGNFKIKPENYDSTLTRLAQTWGYVRQKIELEAQSGTEDLPPDPSSGVTTSPEEIFQIISGALQQPKPPPAPEDT